METTLQQFYFQFIMAGAKSSANCHLLHHGEALLHQALGFTGLVQLPEHYPSSRNFSLIRVPKHHQSLSIPSFLDSSLVLNCT